MTKAEFDRAAGDMTPVRLRDRSACNYANEWYLPIVDENRTRRVDTHTGETHQVDDTMLDALRPRGRGMTVGDVIDRLAYVDRNLRAVIPDRDGGFVDLADVRTDEIAVESRCEDDGPGNRHGPTTEAPWQHDPVERVAILNSAVGGTSSKSS